MNIKYNDDFWVGKMIENAIEDLKRSPVRLNITFIPNTNDGYVSIKTEKCSSNKALMYIGMYMKSQGIDSNSILDILDNVEIKKNKDTESEIVTFTGVIYNEQQINKELDKLSDECGFKISYDIFSQTADIIYNYNKDETVDNMCCKNLEYVVGYMTGYKQGCVDEQLKMVNTCEDKEN